MRVTSQINSDIIRTFMCLVASQTTLFVASHNEMVQGPCAHLGFKCWDMGIGMGYDKCSV
jgi:hypothetical protein